MKKAAIYARVSTLNGQHPEMQLAELSEYASRRGWEIMGVRPGPTMACRPVQQALEAASNTHVEALRISKYCVQPYWCIQEVRGIASLALVASLVSVW